MWKMYYSYKTSVYGYLQKIRFQALLFNKSEETEEKLVAYISLDHYAEYVENIEIYCPKDKS